MVYQTLKMDNNTKHLAFITITDTQVPHIAIINNKEEDSSVLSIISFSDKRSSKIYITPKNKK